MSSNALHLYVASARASLLILTGISSHLSLSPPNAPVPSKQCLKVRSLFERCVRWITFCSKAMIWMMVVVDVYTVYAFYDPPHWSPQVSPTLDREISSSSRRFLSLASSNISRSPEHLIPPIPTTNPHFSIPPLFILGTFAVTLGACLRLWCFRTLGDFFTFELTIRPTHVLVTTGPYSFVRHPSYTGIYLTLLGATAVGFAPGSFLRKSWLDPLLISCSRGPTAASYGWPLERGMPSLLGTLAQVIITVLVAFWFIKVWYALRSTHRRMRVEDIELHKAFGETWERYAERVRWKLLPGVF